MIFRLLGLLVKTLKQSSFIFGAILIAFLVYITIRNQLPDYLALFSGKKSETINKPASDKKEDKKNPYTETLDKVIRDVFSQAGLT